MLKIISVAVLNIFRAQDFALCAVIILYWFRNVLVKKLVLTAMDAL